MKRLNLNSDKTHFIGCWDIENVNLCTNIIKFFEENKELQISGITGTGISDSNVKKTTDIPINPHDLKKPKFKILKNYVNELHKCFLDYQNQWPFLKKIFKSVNVPGFNIQKYSKGDHFAYLHCERSSLNSLHRLFAWMTYLNDVDEGGLTNFTHYKIKVKPKTCKTLIWPAEWTHAHTGQILKSGTKYIVTGWMHFPNSM